MSELGEEFESNSTDVSMPQLITGINVLTLHFRILDINH